MIHGRINRPPAVLPAPAISPYSQFTAHARPTKRKNGYSVCVTNGETPLFRMGPWQTSSPRLRSPIIRHFIRPNFKNFFWPNFTKFNSTQLNEILFDSLVRNLTRPSYTKFYFIQFYEILFNPIIRNFIRPNYMKFHSTQLYEISFDPIIRNFIQPDYMKI